MTLFVGPLGNEGGPSIKNSLTLSYLSATSEIDVLNTYKLGWKDRLSSVMTLLRSTDRQIIVAVSSRGRMILWPLIFWKARRNPELRFSLICIGGTIAGEVKKRPFFLQIMNRASVTCVETQGMARELHDLGANTVLVMPNMVDLKQSGPRQLNRDPIKFVYLSALRDGKGVRTLLEAFQVLICQGFDAELDLYGPIRQDFDVQMLRGCAANPHIAYRGVVAHSRVQDVLHEYDCFVFPSEFETEGFPAVLVEAYAAGLPVIASDVSYNEELVERGRNGLIFRAGDVKNLAYAMRVAAENPEFLMTVAAENMETARLYSPRHVVADYRKALVESGWKI